MRRIPWPKTANSPCIRSPPRNPPALFIALENHRSCAVSCQRMRRIHAAFPCGACERGERGESSLDGAAAESGAGGCLCLALPRIPLHFIQATCCLLHTARRRLNTLAKSIDMRRQLFFGNVGEGAIGQKVHFRRTRDIVTRRPLTDEAQVTFSKILPDQYPPASESPAAYHRAYHQDDSELWYTDLQLH